MRFMAYCSLGKKEKKNLPANIGIQEFAYQFIMFSQAGHVFLWKTDVHSSFSSPHFYVIWREREMSKYDM